MLLIVVGCGGKAEPPANASGPLKEARPGSNSSSEEHSFEVPVAGPTSEQPVSVGAAIFPAAARAGDTVTLAVRARITPGWHISAVRKSGAPGRPTDTVLELNSPNEIQPLGDWLVPPAIPQMGPIGPSDTYAGDVTFLRQLRIDVHHAAGNLNVECSITYQACNDVMCLQPKPVQVQAPIEITSVSGNTRE